MQIGDSAIGQHDHSLLGSKVTLSDYGIYIAIISKIHSVSEFTDLCPTTVQTYEQSGQNWGDLFKDDIIFNTNGDIWYGSNVASSNDGNSLVISYDDNDDDKKCGQIVSCDVSNISNSASKDKKNRIDYYNALLYDSNSWSPNVYDGHNMLFPNDVINCNNNDHHQHVDSYDREMYSDECKGVDDCNEDMNGDNRCQHVDC